MLQQGCNKVVTTKEVKCMKNYVSDSTNGKSLINPKKFKGDVITQVWLDSRVLATLSNWLDKESVMTRFMSEVVRETLEMVVDNLVKDSRVKMVEDTDTARDLLQHKYRVNLNSKDKNGRVRGEKNIVHNIVLSCRKSESESERMYKYEPEVASPVFNNKTKLSDEIKLKLNETSPNFDINEAVKVYKQLEMDKMKKDAENEKEKILANATIDEHGVITPNDFGNSRGVVGEEEMNAYKEEEERKERMERIKKREKVVRKRREKLLEEISLLDEIEEISEGGSEFKGESESE